MKKQLQISLVGTFNQLMIAKNVFDLTFIMKYWKNVITPQFKNHPNVVRRNEVKGYNEFNFC